MKRAKAEALAAVGDNPGRLSSGITSIGRCAGVDRFERCLFAHSPNRRVGCDEGSPLGEEEKA